MKIPQDILTILERCTIDNNTIFLPNEQLDRPTYTKVNKCLENIGGKWNRKTKGHIFDHDPTEGLENLLLTGKTEDWKKTFQFFPTPKTVAKQMCDIAELTWDSIVLEPSIGKGDLADVIYKQGISELIGVELNKDMQKHLDEKPYVVFIGVDFLDFVKESIEGKIKRVLTHIIMNPPFTKQQDLDHIRAAYELLPPGGILVSVASTSWQWRDNKKTVAFREWLENLEHEIIELPAGSFKISGTMIQTTIIKIRREGALEEKAAEPTTPTKTTQPAVETMLSQQESPINPLNLINPRGGFSMIQSIALEKIIPHEHNPRQALGDLTELTDSIKQSGILQNLTVVECDIEDSEQSWSNSKPHNVVTKGYKVIIGHRRLAAARLAGLETVPCAVVQMDEPTQIATMLLENMQRSDLTPIEQAKGVQMLLDLGETTSSIAQKTGFSRSTIRARKKLLGLDQDKLKQAESRGATLKDYAELDKVKSQELKDKVLEYIGTKEFNWELQRAIDKEELDEALKELHKKLDKFATKITTDTDMAGLVRYYGINHASHNKSYIKAFEPPEDALEGEGKYFYRADEYSTVLYTLAGQDEPLDEDEDDEESEAQAQAEAENQARYNQLKALTTQAYNMRMEFVKRKAEAAKNSSPSSFPLLLEQAFIKQAATTIISHDIGRLERTVFCDYFNLDEESHPWHSNDEAVETFPKARKRLMGDLGSEPPIELLEAIYLRLERGSETLIGYNGKYKYNPSAELNTLYALLTALGYETSEEEAAIINGTHELYG